MCGNNWFGHVTVPFVAKAARMLMGMILPARKCPLFLDFPALTRK
jgi:hypothetical protein